MKQLLLTAVLILLSFGAAKARNIPRYAKFMTGNPQIKTALEPSTKNEQERERRQREWMKKKGIE